MQIRMNAKYINILNTLLILLLLGIPFVIKTIDMRLEIFPSVILPSSSGTINIKENVFVNKTELYGVLINKDTVELNKSKFMGKIPLHYLENLISNKFGLKPFLVRNEKTNKFSITYNVHSKVSDAEIKETKIWLRNRLREQHCNDSILIIKKRSIELSPNRVIINKNAINYDTIFNLY